MNHLQVIKLNKFDIKNYTVEIFSLVVSFYLSTWLFKFLDLNKEFFIDNYFVCKENFSPLPLIVIKLIVWLVIYYIFLNVVLMIWKFFWSSNSYIYRRGDLYKNWIFHGNVEETDEDGVLSIYNCYAGCLLANKYWKNFELSIKLIFGNEEKINKRAGILFYAEDLENYCMLQIIVEDKQRIFIKPHIRRNGLFEVFKESPVDISMEENKYYELKLIAKGREVTLFCDGRKIFFWYIPNRVVPNHIPINYELQKNGDDRAERREGINVYKPFFVEKPGFVGFRASFNEKFKIKDIIIRRI